MWLLPACLLVACVFGIVLRNARMSGTAFILIVNWLVNTAVCQWTGENYPWPWFLSVDYLSGLVILIMAGKPTFWQSIVTSLFALECIAHGSFGLSRQTEWTEYYYWYTLHYVAWSQLWIVATWGACDFLARLWSRDDRGASSSVTRMERNKPPRAKP